MKDKNSQIKKVQSRLKLIKKQKAIKLKSIIKSDIKWGLCGK